jgi:hypothetical protein
LNVSDDSSNNSNIKINTSKNSVSNSNENLLENNESIIEDLLNEQQNKIPNNRSEEQLKNSNLTEIS